MMIFDGVKTTIKLVGYNGILLATQIITAHTCTQCTQGAHMRCAHKVQEVHHSRCVTQKWAFFDSWDFLAHGTFLTHGAVKAHGCYLNHAIYLAHGSYLAHGVTIQGTYIAS